ncbi:MAG: ribonuclease Z [Nanoarchaeota archaeon]|nr:ribonuclease Z [Nanoarchaeota archaeon]
MQLTILGTSSMVPTKERNVSGIFLDYNGDCMLIDCGEGTQRQMNIAGINRNKVKKVLITHWHGDHVSGLIGLIQTLGNSEIEEPTLHVFGPKGTKERMFHLMNTVSFESKVNVKVKDLDPRGKLLKFFENTDYALECIDMRHSTPCLGYSFVEKDKLRIQMPKAKKLGLKEGPLIGKLQRGETVKVKGKEITPEMVATQQKGKKVTFIMDTQQTNNTLVLAESADLLVIETTYLAEKEENALKFKHMTTNQVGMIAHTAGVKKMIMTHFSQRYKETGEFEKEARLHFPESYAAYDFMKIKV